MTTVRIIYDVDGWAYHARAIALQKYAPPDLQIETSVLSRREQMDTALGTREPDIVFTLSQPELPRVRRALAARAWHSKLIGSWNCGWPLEIPQFYISYAVADAVVINNAMAWERIGRLPRTYLLPNGVDRDVFRVRVPLDGRRPRVLWTGSELKRQRKGYDQFVLPLQRELRSLGIDGDSLLVDSFGDAKRPPREMAAWYNTGTVLFCASSVEGTPNPALEAAACGCTIVSTPVGNMPELIRDGSNGYLVERRLDALLSGIRAACADHLRLAMTLQEDIRAWDWRERSAGFYRMFREVLSPPLGKTPAPDWTLGLHGTHWTPKSI